MSSCHWKQPPSCDVTNGVTITDPLCTTVLQQDRGELDIYVRHCSRILKAVANFTHSELTKVEVDSVTPKGGYYMLPNFDLLKDKMKTLGIQQGREFFEKIFVDTSVGAICYTLQ